MLQPNVLRYFAEVARTGSLRVTADQQQIAPSALSRQINQLEKFLDTKLFIRSTKGMQLTEIGRELLSFVEENNRNIDALVQRIEDIDHLRRASVRIASVEGTTISFLPAVMARFSRGFPGIRYEVVVSNTHDVADRVAAGDSEIGIAFNCPSRDDLILRARIPQPLHLIGRSDNPALRRRSISLAEMASLKLALPTRQFSIRRIIEQSLRTTNLVGTIALETNSLMLIRQVITQTDLLTCMPEFVFENEVRSNVVSTCAVEDRLAQAVTLDVVTRHGHTLSGEARRFLSILLEAAKEKTQTQLSHAQHLVL
ncbi:MAG: LysR family transcriptional regulator [Betaproteobacteria bacterium]|nr:LysR family transcriptional regulator [Betaproteobacteria bacterium]